MSTETRETAPLGDILPLDCHRGDFSWGGGGFMSGQRGRATARISRCSARANRHSTTRYPRRGNTPGDRARLAVRPRALKPQEQRAAGLPMRALLLPAGRFPINQLRRCLSCIHAAIGVNSYWAQGLKPPPLL